MSSNTVILFLTHSVNAEILRRFRLLEESCGDAYDVFFALNDEIGYDLACLHGYNVFTFTCKDIMAQGYTPCGHGVMHNVNYVMQLFRKRHPQYTYYWKVEYDAVFTGNWIDFFSYFDDREVDFIASHIEIYSDANKKWPWWYLTDWNGFQTDISQCVKSFNPIVRISDNALNFMDGFLRSGVMGHFEVVEATVLYNNGFSLLDMGGIGEFSDKNCPNHFYVQGKGINAGTMRWRPDFMREEVEAFAHTGKIFHPVKY